MCTFTTNFASASTALRCQIAGGWSPALCQRADVAVWNVRSGEPEPVERDDHGDEGAEEEVGNLWERTLRHWASDRWCMAGRLYF